MNDPVIRWQHTPQYEAGCPVFPESPVLPSPFLLRGMRGWHWQVEVEVHTLQYFVEGHGIHDAGDRSHEIKPGACFLLRPGEQVMGRALDERPFTIFAAHFDEVTPEARAGDPLHCQIHELRLMESLAEHAVKCRLDDNPRSRNEARAAIHAMYHLFLGNLHRPVKPAVQVQIESLIEAIRRDPGANWPVDRMCESVRISRSNLTRWFNTLTGMSPTRYVIHQRITRAVELITMTRRGIEEIASELGYRDVQFFTRQFTRMMGRPPGRFRGHKWDPLPTARGEEVR
ncbi:MAG: AraC family transcriptional regulator [Akkermansiaceae bacterium]|jgi:AraC-like DNA-binding protein|nr:AraC family transcriptional regulator [Akkermansiaceae bacterium]